MGVISITLTPEGDDDVICEEIVDEYEYEKEVIYHIYIYDYY